jgi:hypothetical protein
MCSTRKTTGRLLAGLSVAPLLVGCLKQTEPPAAISRAPLVLDEAMERRTWPTVAVHFQNGETPAWPTGFVLDHRPDAPKWAPAVTDTPLFLANIFAMPIGYTFTPGWTRVIYPNDVVPPTYNAMPPLPPAK